MSYVYDPLLDSPYKGLMPYSETDRLLFFGREKDRENIVNLLITWKLSILYGASGVGKSSVLRAGVAHHLCQTAQKNADITGKPGLAVIVFPPVEGELKDQISWQDPLRGIKMQLKTEIEKLGVKPPQESDNSTSQLWRDIIQDEKNNYQQLSLVDTLKAWLEIIRDREGKSRLFIILDQFEEYLNYLSQNQGKDFAEEFPKAVNNLELSVNFLIGIREDGLAKLDYFQHSIPNLTKHRRAIQHLDEKSAIEAIEEPIYEYNRQTITRNSLRNFRLTILYGDRNTHKTTLLRLGIAHYLRHQQKLGVVLFSSWHKDRDWQTVLKQQIQADLESLVKEDSHYSDYFTPPSLDLSLVDNLREWSKIFGKQERDNQIFLILDQFEDYFDNRQELDKSETFIQELLSVIKDDSLKVNLLISLRQDRLSKLEQYFQDIPQGKLQYLKLFKDKGIDCIAKGETPTNVQPLVEIGIEPDLAKTILNDLVKKQEGSGQPKPELVEDSSSRVKAEVKIEAPYLQLIMTRLWNEEKERFQTKEVSSLQLGKTTYTKLGLKKIVKEHLSRQIEKLDNWEQEAASRILYYLITPSGKQLLTLSVEDLTKFANQNRLSEEPELESKQVKDLLEKLSGGVSRLLCSTAGGYRIFFPILAEAVSHWLQRRRAIRDIEQGARKAQEQFKSSQLEALLTAMRAGKILQGIIEEDQTLVEEFSTLNLIQSLEMIVNNIQEKNQFQRPESSVYSVNFSPDGQKCAFGSSKGTIFVWDLQEKQLKSFSLSSSSDAIYYVSFDPDGKMLAVAFWDGTVRLWDLQDLQYEDKKPTLLKELKDHEAPVYWLSFSRNRKLATASGDGKVRLWDLANSTQQPIAIAKHESPIYCVSVSSNGQMLATASWMNAARLWQLQEVQEQESQEKKLQLIEVTSHYQDLGETKSASCVAFSPNGELLAAASSIDGTVKLWDLQDKDKLPTSFENPQKLPASHLSFIREEQQLYIATVSLYGTVCLWDLKSKQPTEFPGSQKTLLYRASFSPDGKHLATVGADSIVRLWDLKHKENQRQEVKYQNNSYRVSWNPSRDKRQLSTACWDGTVRVYDLDKANQETTKLPAPSKAPAYSVSFSPDGTQLAIAFGDGTIQVRDWQSKTLKASFQDIQSAVYCVSFRPPNGKQLATASEDGIVRLWDLEISADNTLKLTELDQLKGHKGPVYYLSFSSDGKYLATASVDCTAHLWKLEKQGRKIEFPELLGHRGPVYWVSFSPDGQLIATASGDGTVYLWNLQEKDNKPNKPTQKYKHDEPVFCVNFVPDRQQLVTACSDGIVRLWNWKGKLLAEFKNHQDIVFCASPSPDGKLLATASLDGTVKVQPLEEDVKKRIETLERLLNRGCTWLEDYFAANPDAW